MKKGWKRFEAPKTKKEWVKTVLIGLLLLALVHVFIGAPYAGWWPAYGRSAWPTMKWFTVWPYLSGYTHINKSEKGPEPGDIVTFRVPGSKWYWPQTEVKRVEKIETRNGQQYMWLTTDNIGMTGEASSGEEDARYGWVPLSSIIGTVDDIWTPERAERSRSVNGRFVNRIQLQYSPLVTKWSPDGEYAAINHENRLLLVGANGFSKNFSRPVDFRWQSDRLYLVYQVKEEGGEIYKQEMLAQAPDFNLTKKPSVKYSLPFPGYEIRGVVEFYEVAAGERRVAEVSSGTYVYLSSPGSIKLHTSTGVESLEPRSIRLLQGGKYILEIPNGPPFDVPLGEEERVYVLLLAPI